MDRNRIAACLVICLGVYAPGLSMATDATQAGVRNGSGGEILLQGFHWNSSRQADQTWYQTLTKKSAQIAADDFTAIWMPPPWRDESHWQDDQQHTFGGGEGYFWRDFDKNGRYGSDAQLQAAAEALKGAGVKVIFDVVPNHKDGVCNGLPMDKEAVAAGKCARGLTRDEGDAFMSGDADLDTADPSVDSLFRVEFANLRDRYAAEGLRFDFVKGYAPERVDGWMKRFGDRLYCVGELWKAPGEFPQDDWRRSAGWQDILKDWSDRAHCSVFDFALKERMQNGSLREWRYGLNANPDASWRAAAVTFVDNHDTGYSPGANGGQHHWALPEERRDQAYAYVLTSPGTPSVYWPDMYDWPRGGLLRQLIAARRAVGIRADSTISFALMENHAGLVSLTQGDQGSLLLALDSDLGAAPGGFEPVVLAHDNGPGKPNIRLWRATDRRPWVEVVLSCENGTTNPGDSVYVVGDSVVLGGWKPANALRLKDVSQYPLWQGRVSLPADQDVQWKCIVRSETAPEVVRRWQAGDNNVLKAGVRAGSGRL